MKLRFAVIHELKKDSGELSQPSELKAAPLDLKNPVVRSLTQRIEDMIGQKGNAATYGTFRIGGDRPKFADDLIGYQQAGNPGNDEFVAVTHSCMESLKTAADGEPLATGGCIFFADYLSERNHYFLTVMIKERDGIRLNRDLVPEDVTQLDLNKLHQVARVTFDALAQYLATEDEDARSEMTYLHFVSPKRLQSAAGYFVKGLGCTPGSSATRATRKLITEGRAFFEENELLKSNASDFGREVVSLLDTAHRETRSVKLSEVEDIARKYIPKDDEDVVEEIVNDFYQRLQSERNQIPTEFVPTREIKRFTEIWHTAPAGWKIRFERSSLGTDRNATIRFDADSNQLTIRNLDPEFVAKLNEALDE